MLWMSSLRMMRSRWVSTVTHTNIELAGNLLVAKTFRNVEQDFPFAIGEPRQRRALVLAATHDLI
ncbi:MAG: hypothetical protein QM813_26125 [Verrucomicrobiota bacterium]